MNEEHLDMMRLEMQDVLENNILPFWLEKMQDNENGGFYGRIDGSGVLHPDAEKGAILNARILWTFSAAYRVLEKEELLEAATRAKDYLVDHFIDPEYGGVYWSVDYKDFAGLVNSSAAQCRHGEGARPYFVLQHRRPYAELRKALSAHGNAVSFFGHNHWSASNWNVISLYGAFPCIQCPSCEPRGCTALTWDSYISKAPLEGREPEKVGAGRQGFVVSLYDDMMVIARYDMMPTLVEGRSCKNDV